MARTSRRALLSAGATAALASIAVAASAMPATAAAEPVSDTHPDAELMALCDRFEELERMCRTTFGRTEGVEGKEAQLIEQAGYAEREPWIVEQEELFEQIDVIPATTLDSARAVARIWNAWDSEVKAHGGPDGFMNERMAWKLIRDLVGGSI
ncbi:MAG: hypothetical protein ACRYG8_51705 [Janthinobacterium lividum]